jgi:hypothetical protein
LVDVTEVMSALMTSYNNISQLEVDEAAVEKAAARGRFKSGAWLLSDA